MNLRPYQLQAQASVKEHYLKGVNKQVIVLATGTGKTVIFSHIAKDIIQEKKKKVLVLAHREELLTQAKDKLLTIDPTLRVGIEMADQHCDPEVTDVVVASVATIGRLNSKRLGKFNIEDFGLIITDESHHAPASTYKNVYRHFGILKCEPENDWNKDLLHLGVTATPQRSDNENLEDIFDTVTFVYGIIDAINDKWLARIKAFRINTATDLSHIHKQAGDFKLDELAEAVNNEERNKLIVKTYLDKTPYRQALCFAVDINHTIELTKEFRRQGVAADYVIGATPKDERKQKLIDFNQGKIQVMVNCTVLTEGFDEPSIEAVLMARPTQSGILFQQMVGRGTRLYEGKDCLTVIDFVDNTYRQNLQTSAKLIGIPGNLDFQGQDILTVKEEVDKLLELAPNINLERLDIKNIKYAIEEVDLLSGLKIPDELSEYTNFDWHRYGEDTYRIGLGNDHAMVLQQTITGQWVLVKQTIDPNTHHEVNQPLGSWKELKDAISNTDKYITVKMPDVVKLISDDAKWRRDKPSDAQITLLQRMRVNDMVLANISKGEASRLITKLINNQKKGFTKFA